MLEDSKVINDSSGQCCAICDGAGKNLLEHGCSFCSGTGAFSKAAESMMKHHKCLCKSIKGNKICLVCKNRCHHNNGAFKRILASL